MKNSHIDIQKNQDILQKGDWLKQTWRFVPKHLMAIRIQEKRGGRHNAMQQKIRDKDATYQQSSIEIINKNKNLYLAPVRDIEKIMKHFKRKFQDTGPKQIIQSIKGTKNKKKRLKRTKTDTSEILQPKQQLIEDKIVKILELPTIKRANSQAHRLKMINMEESNHKSFEKQRILKKFDHYFAKQMDLINSKRNDQNAEREQSVLQRLRIKTSID